MGRKRMSRTRFVVSRAIAFALLLAPAPVLAAEQPLTQRLTTLSNAGSGEASYYLGMIYHLGMDGVAKDKRKAFALFKQSAERNDPLGAYKYGCYFDGQAEGVVKPDPKLALRYKLIAAEAGYALAQEDVATHLFADGDKMGSVRWLERAAQQGSPTALMALGGLYAGMAPPGAPPVTRDPGRGYGYLLMAAREVPEMKAALQAELTKLPPDERKRASELEANWQPKPTALTLKVFQGFKAAETLAAAMAGR
jgi:TPR repeat protein